MALTYTQLIRFDLLNELEKRLFSDQDQLEQFFDFQRIALQIDNADHFIKELPSFPHSNKNIVRDELVSAIGSTLAIEGITVADDEIRETLDAKTTLQDSIQRRKQEVLNSQDVYDYIISEIDGCKGKYVYTPEGINSVHERFTGGIDYLGNSPGRYRNTQAIFGDPSKQSLCGQYTEIYEAMKLFVEWLNSEKVGIMSGNKIAKAIMAHYYLTEIHAFGDGNGRTARAIEAMVLYEHNINTYCFWSLANFWSAHRSDYILRLADLRRTCDPYDFVMWGAKGYLGEVLRIKSLVLQKVKQLMFKDYLAWLHTTNKDREPERRVNKRMLLATLWLNDAGKMSLKNFRKSTAHKALYSKPSPMTRSRDLSKMKSLELIKLTSKDEEDFIEPNYDIFTKFEYTVGAPGE